MLKDYNGEVVPFGKTKRIIEENFMISDELPAWMTVSKGIYRINPINSGVGYFELKTGSLQNDLAEINLFPEGIDMSSIKELIIELDSFSVNNRFSELIFSVKDKLNANGYEIISFASRAFGVLENVYTAANTKYTLELNRRVNIKIVMRNDGTLVLMENDTVVFERVYQESEVNFKKVVYPKISMKNSGVISTLQVSRIALSIAHN